VIAHSKRSLENPIIFSNAVIVETVSHAQRRTKVSFLRRCAIATTVVAACVFGISASANAGTLPDISGRWYAQGDHSKPCHITQSGYNLTLTNEVGSRATWSPTDNLEACAICWYRQGLRFGFAATAV
jgi:hypothetical protein